MRRSFWFASVVGCLLFCGMSLIAQNKTSELERQIRAADQEWMKVFAAKDIDKSVAFVQLDGSVLAPNMPIATGPDAIRKSFSGLFALPDLKISWTPAITAVAKSGELGYTQGAYQMTYTADGKSVSDRGKYVTIWRKQTDGTWKVVADIFNSDLPQGQ